MGLCKVKSNDTALEQSLAKYEKIKKKLTVPKYSPFLTRMRNEESAGSNLNQARFFFIF